MANDDDKSPDQLALSDAERKQRELEEERRMAKLAADVSRRYDPARLGKFAVAGAGKIERLDDATRRKMESRLGGNFSDVRVVRGPIAERVTRRHGADAVTIGATGLILVRDTARTNPNTASGKAVLAHELTHVRQAQKGMHFALTQGSDNAPHEKEAHKVEAHTKHHEKNGPHASHQSAAEAEQAREERRERAVRRVLEKIDEELRFEVNRLGFSNP